MLGLGGLGSEQRGKEDLRMEVRSVERTEGRGGVPRGFSRPDALSPTEESAIELLGAVLVSERARPAPKRVLISGKV